MGTSSPPTPEPRRARRLPRLARIDGARAVLPQRRAPTHRALRSAGDEFGRQPLRAALRRHRARLRTQMWHLNLSNAAVSPIRQDQDHVS